MDFRYTFLEPKLSLLSIPLLIITKGGFLIIAIYYTRDVGKEVKLFYRGVKIFYRGVKKFYRRVKSILPASIWSTSEASALTMPVKYFSRDGEIFSRDGEIFSRDGKIISPSVLHPEYSMLFYQTPWSISKQLTPPPLIPSETRNRGFRGLAPWWDFYKGEALITVRGA